MANGLGMLAAALIALPIMGSDGAPGTDGMFHVIRAEHALDLLKHGRLDGWMPHFFSGHEAFLFNSGGLPLVTAFLSLLSFGLFSPLDITMLLLFVSFVALPPAVAYLARSFGMSGLAGGIAGALALLVDHYLGFGTSGVFDIGLLAHQVASPLWAISLGLIIRSVDTDDRVVHLRAALAVTVTCLVSPVTVEIIGFHSLIVLPLLFAANPAEISMAIKRIVPVFFLTLTGTAMWWLPAWANRELVGSRTTGEEPSVFERSRQVLAGETGLPGGFLILVVVAIALVMIPQWKLPNRAALAFSGVVALVGGHLVGQSGWLVLLLGHLPNRALTHGLVLSMLPLAAALAWAGTTIDAGTRGRGTMRLMAPLAGVAALIALVWPSFGFGAARTPAPTSDFFEVARFLNEETAKGSRFGVVDQFGVMAVTGVPAPNLWLSEASGVPVATGLGFESTNTWIAFDAASNVSGSAASASLQVRAGVTHLVTISDSDSELANSPRYGLVAQSGELVVWQVFPDESMTPPPRLVASSSSHQTYTYRVGEDAQSDIDLPVAHSPKWKAFDEQGNRLDVSRTNDGLLRVSPATSDSLLTIHFTADRYDHLGEFLTLFSVVMTTIFGFGWPIYKRRSTSERS